MLTNVLFSLITALSMLHVVIDLIVESHTLRLGQIYEVGVTFTHPFDTWPTNEKDNLDDVLIGPIPGKDVSSDEITMYCYYAKSRINGRVCKNLTIIKIIKPPLLAVYEVMNGRIPPLNDFNNSKISTYLKTHK